MTILLVIAVLMVVVGGLILWGCHDYVAPTDPGKCRIIMCRGEATGEIRGPGMTFVLAQGIIGSYVEIDRRFEIEVPEFKFDCPNDHIPLIAMPTLVVELRDNGGKLFNLNGGKDGSCKKIARIVRTEMQEFAANPGKAPQTYEEAKKMISEFVLHAVDSLVKDDLKAQAAVASDRSAFIKKLEQELSEGEGGYEMNQFGLTLKAFNMGNFTEPKNISDAEATKVAAARDAEMKKANIVALKDRVDTLTAGHDNVSFKDATMAVQIQEGTIQHKINEEIVRIVDEGSGDGIGKLIGGVIAAARANSGGGKNNGKP